MTRDIVVKFGGTSVKTASAVRQVSQIVAANQSIRVIVVSAVGGATDLLLGLCKEPVTARPQLVKHIVGIYLNLAHDLGLSIEHHIRRALSLLTKLVDIDQPDNHMIDQALSLGEYTSSLIVHAYLESQGIDITYLDARSYLITDGHEGQAVPSLAAIKRRLEELPAGLCITQGFIAGSSFDGRITTLGRGSSDYSAALIAEGLSARELLIYTDVLGVYTADPRTSPSAHFITQISARDMAAMAYNGAKVLHPGAVETCIRAQIPFRVRSTFEPEHLGTYIDIALC